MGTNENENIKIKMNEVVENTDKMVDEPKFDMQATQRIVIIDELEKDTEKFAKLFMENKRGDVAPKKDVEQVEKVEQDDKPIKENNDVSNEKIDILNNGSENSVEPGVQTENSFQEVIVSNNDAPQNPNQLSQQLNTENIADTSATTDKEEKEESNNQNVQIENKDEQKSKEKQHAQDKKDYRLEKMLFDRINKMQGKIKESLELIKKFERINAKEENLPNIVTTLHDKLTHEVIKQFRTVGIEFNMKSYLVQAIVSDLLNKFEEGITEFKDCSENLNFVREVQEDFESRVELAPTSRVKNFFARIRGMFKPERKQERLQQLERERQEKKLEEANIHLIKYKFINSELERYTIRKNIVNSLTREILYGQGSGLTLNINDFISEKIEPEMKKLGLDGCIPELKQRIFDEYKLKDENISQEDFEKYSVGEIRKNIKLQKTEFVMSKINNVISTNKSVEEDDERMAI